MKLFYGEINEKLVIIQDEEQQHITKVLRMKVGDEIFVTDGKGNLAKGNLVLEGKKALISATKIQNNLPKMPINVHIAIAPTKNIDRTEFFLEKSVEMGVSEITFLLTDKSERKNINIEKLRKQAVSASKQSQRTHFPIVNDLTKFSDFINSISAENTFVAHCDSSFERTELNQIIPQENIVFLIGPEGDFSPKEIEILVQKNIKAISLGFQRLRTETAGIFVSAWSYNQMIQR